MVWGVGVVWREKGNGMEGGWVGMGNGMDGWDDGIGWDGMCMEVCMEVAWDVHGMCMGCAWDVHGWRCAWIFLSPRCLRWLRRLRSIAPPTCNPPGSEGEVLQAIHVEDLDALNDSLCSQMHPNPMEEHHELDEDHHQRMSRCPSPKDWRSLRLKRSSCLSRCPCRRSHAGS